MKKIFFIALFLGLIQAKGQFTVTLQLPPNGLLLKSQLWNMIAINNSTAGKLVHVEMKLYDPQTNAIILSATSSTITVQPGSQFIQQSMLSPIQYNAVDPSYGSFVASDFLPAGEFLVCFTFIEHASESQTNIAEECDDINIEPLLPPRLVYPWNQTPIDTRNPVFNWLPPAPLNTFTDLKYDFTLVEVYTGQSEADAIALNIPLCRQSNLSDLSLLYPQGATVLDLNKKYAWQITAKNGQASAGQSEVWWFTIKDFASADSALINDIPYSKLRKDNVTGYAIFSNELKFDYLNENADSLWNVAMYDITAPEKKQIDFPMDSIPLRPGENLVKYLLSNNGAFIDKHLFLLEVINSRQESWKLKFEYRKPENK